MTLPLVSCIITVYNGEKYIREAVESVRRQTYPNLEIIVADDGSTDRTAEIVQSLGPDIRYGKRANGGPGAARNFGMKMASAGILAFLDGDDIWHDEKIARQVDRLESSGAEVCFTLVRNFWEEEAVSEKNIIEEKDSVKFCSPFLPSSFMARRSVFEKSGEWDEKHLRGEDCRLFYRLKEENVVFEVLDEILVHRRLHSRNISRDLSIIRRETILQWAKAALQKHKEKEKPALKNSKSSAHFEQGMELYRRACTEKSADHYFLAGGFTIRLSFANETLIPFLTPALEHLRVSKVPNPELTIHIWDCESTGSELPSVPEEDKDTFPGKKEKADTNLFLRMNVGPGIVNAFDKNSGTAFYCARTARNFPQAEAGAPFVKIFSWWARGNGLKLIHAAALGTPLGGVLLAGKGGSGKSTAALSSLAPDSGLLYLSDDYCLVRLFPLYVYSLYGTGKISRSDLPKVPHLKGAQSTLPLEDSGKELFFIRQKFPEKLSPYLPLRAIFVPRISGGEESSLEPASRAEALKALAPSTMFQLPGSRGRDLQDLAEFVKNLPCYVLNAGSDPSKLVRTIFDFLHGHDAAILDPPKRSI